MADFNKVILMGNLTRDPEIRYTSGNMPVVNIGLAVNDRVKNRQTDQWEERPNFFNCVAFGRTAEIINQYFKKGKPIFIDGQLRWDSWEDKQSGQKRSKVEVIINNFQFIDGGGDGQQGGGGGGGYQGGGRSSGDYQGGGGYQGGGASQSPPPPDMGSDDDIPF